MKPMTLLTSLFLLAAVACQSQTATLEPTLELRTVDGVTVPYQNNMPMPAFEKQQRPTISLAGTWRKKRFAANDALTLSNRAAAMPGILSESMGREGRDYNDSAWPVITLPAVENRMNAYEVQPEFYEDGVWYRRTFSVPDSLRGRYIKLIFYAVNYVADVWINGEYIGYHEGGYTPFAFDVSAVLNYGTDNTIALRIDNPAWGSRKDIVPFVKVDWFNYTGVIHDLYLEATDPVSIVRCQAVPQSTTGELLIRTVIGNQSENAQSATATLEIFKANVTAANQASEQAADLIGEPAAFSGTAETTLEIPVYNCRVWQTSLQIADPALWTPKNPNIYILRVTLRRDGKIIDRFHSQFGLRTLATSGNKVLVNGKPIFYTGVARHEDSPDYGRSIPVAKIFSDMQLLKKSLAVQFVRTAHYPNHPATYLFADRLGLAIEEEIPVWWFDDQEAWDIQNNVRHIHEQMWREMVFRDYNRPSIYLWSTCNECLDVDHRKIFIERVNAELDSLYPDGRFVTQSAAADRPGANDASQGACDVMGWTMYFGIFHGGAYGSGTASFLTKVATAWPDKPALCTEYGYWSTPDGSSEATQVKVFKDTFTELEARSAVTRTGTVRDSGMLMAATWWCAFDWYSHTQGNDSWQTMGLYHMDRVTKKKVAGELILRYLSYSITGGTVSAVKQPQEEAARPGSFRLTAAYPNPFNSRTVISYDLSQAAEVHLDLLNLRGEVVETLYRGMRPAGHFEQVWDSRSAASGLYLVRLRSGARAQMLKVTLLK
ncbi:MAG TPA: glycoside hydrolase family 2 TIM barrel-domain containing protein [bacterium]|nr:glycoside hydrolase family 2 TIM barrel-domain containing protein [bacterium]HQG45649.1 glycoside hydrolase family 2 TIM barrel-domain containing protein [bacterium]HQI50153.1 glycoside hydrolase family 2 TIM barrel-domain containing protein [bacterium]HQJ66006.1 glycoside hydrolase family 2 TIM barrel-domain containing protein [bacterium]